MAKPVNLNKARKARAKAKGEAKAEENRAKFGQPKSVSELEAARTKRRKDTLDAHKREED